MGEWNRPRPGGVPKPAPRRPSFVRGALAGLLVVVLAAGGYLAFLADAEKPQPQAVERARRRPPVRERRQAPSAAVREETNAVPAETAVEKPKPKPKHPGFGKYPVEVDENGDRWIVRNGRRRKVIRGGPVGTRRRLWFNGAENAISALVTVKPGDTIVGFEIGPGFKEEFANSLLNKIEITPEDTPEEAEEKRLVREAKNELVKAIRNGEDVERIMREEYRNVMKMYNYRQNLLNGLKDLREKGASVRDLDDYVKAANRLMEQHGMADSPVRLHPKERLMLALERGEEIELKGEAQSNANKESVK